MNHRPSPEMPTIRRLRPPEILTDRCLTITTVFLLLSLPPLSTGIRSFPATGATTSPAKAEDYMEAPEYRNGDDCGNTVVHIAMTLDSEYLRGTVAGIHSVLRHASCPENTFFHLITTESDPTTPPELSRIIRTTFPSLTFKLHIFRQHTVTRLISSSIRVALENPLNYARNYLGEILDPTVTRVIYLDSDVIVVDDIQNLWSIRLPNKRVIGAPEYCHANFTKYFTDSFWSDPVLPRVFGSRTRAPCYFNTGVMVVDMVRWRSGGYRRRLEEWMLLQREKRIYELGSLPPFLLVFGGEVEPVDHRWNQHGLGGDNVRGSCRRLHPGPVSLLHWSGKGKPWVRLDEGRACALDYLWRPYDLHWHWRKGRRRWLDLDS